MSNGSRVPIKNILKNYEMFLTLYTQNGMKYVRRCAWDRRAYGVYASARSVVDRVTAYKHHDITLETIEAWTQGLAESLFFCLKNGTSRRLNV